MRHSDDNGGTHRNDDEEDGPWICAVLRQESRSDTVASSGVIVRRSGDRAVEANIGEDIGEDIGENIEQLKQLWSVDDKVIALPGVIDGAKWVEMGGCRLPVSKSS